MVRGPVSNVVNVRFPNRKVHREQSQVRQSVPRTRRANRPPAGRGRQDFGVAQHAFGRRLRALSEDQEFPLACLWPALPRLSFDARRAIGRDFRDHRPARRARKLGGTTLRSIGQIAKLQTIQDNNESYVPPRDMLRELMEDNKHMAAAMRKAHELCDQHGDSGTAGLLETFIDETERRTWFLFEASRQEGSNAA